MQAHGLAGDPASTDTDLDGVSDLLEFATGSDPLAASPQPLVVEFAEDGVLIIRFPSDG